MTSIGKSAPLLKIVTVCDSTVLASVVKIRMAGARRTSFGSRQETTPGVMNECQSGGAPIASKKFVHE